MPTLRSAHTADLPPDVLLEARALLDRAFAGDLGEHDWEHALGGIHVLATDGGRLVGHAALVMRRLLHGGRALRTGYVEAVGVDRCARGRGCGAALMAEVERLVRGGYELGALGSTDEALGFYAARGWRRWTGPTYALTPRGVVRTHEEDGGVLVLPASAALDWTAALTCDWRDGSPW